MGKNDGIKSGRRLESAEGKTFSWIYGGARASVYIHFNRGNGFL